MNLPKQGTYERKVLDYLFTIQPRMGRQIKSIKENFGSSISQATLERVIDAGLIDGTVVHFCHRGFALSAEARKEYRKLQDAIAPVAAAPALKVLNPSLHMKTKGTREGSDWSRDKFPSVAAPFSKSA
ncbi:Hypothetical protein HEAR2298 [Herminiimonas arsenicoxydans]|uniref:Uncharacterized protein n=1 Tax=Herminiimonas arsenicoxydans TaxID=204773 RepID=A4G7E2_HERAR|nr:Hypothetical protein HEAR2298 [Herminiimonas arsenicoxydans]